MTVLITLPHQHLVMIILSKVCQLIYFACFIIFSNQYDFDFLKFF